MRKLIEFTKNWKYRNLLHIVGGFLIGGFLSLLFAWYVSLCIVFAFANYWEYSQKKTFWSKVFNFRHSTDNFRWYNFDCFNTFLYLKIHNTQTIQQ